MFGERLWQEDILLWDVMRIGILHFVCMRENWRSCKVVGALRYHFLKYMSI